MAVPEQLISSTYTLPAQLSCFRMQAVNQFVFVAKSVLELQVWPQHSLDLIHIVIVRVAYEFSAVM